MKTTAFTCIQHTTSSNPALLLLLLSFPGEPKSLRRKLDDYSVYLRAARDILQSGIEQVQRSIRQFLLRALGLAVLLYWLCCTDMTASNPQPIPFLAAVAKIVMVVVVAALVWLSVVVKRSEMQGLLATKLDLDRLISDKVKSQ